MSLQVLIVDDSSVIRQLLRHILEEAGMSIVAEAENGLEAITMAQQHRPDVITMDVHMPVMNGFQATQQIMATCPTPIVVVSASNNIGESVTALQVLEAGAITIMCKPQGPAHPHFQQDARALIKMLHLAASVHAKPVSQPAVKPPPTPAPPVPPRIVLVGASTGGPTALKDFLSHLGTDLPWPVLIVQHIAPGFLPSLCEWLNQHSAIPVRIAEYGESVLPAHAYLAPDLCHMQVDSHWRIRLLENSTGSLICPSVGQLFKGGLLYQQGHCIAILLSGMGQDGVEEMLQLRQAGAITLAQHPDTVVINGMPGAAVKRGAASQVLTPEQMATLAMQLGRNGGKA